MATSSDLLTLQALVAELHEQVTSVQRENVRLRHQLDAALHRLYGRKTERWQQPVPEQGQLPLAGEAPPSEALPAESDDDEHDPPAAPTGSAPAKRGGGRKPLPRDLPRTRTVIEPKGATLTCARCTTAKTCIGSDVTEELDYTPAVLRVHEIVRPKYACPHCEDGVVQAPVPARPIDQGRPGPGLLAHVVTAKYADHRVPRMHTRTPQGGKGKQCCDRDEGGPLDADVQALASNHLTLRGLRVRVVNGEDTARRERVRYGSGSRTQVNRRRRVEKYLADIKTGEGGCPGRSSGSAC